MTETLLNDPEAITWLLDGHLADKWRDLGDVLPAFGAAVIRGNEDCPDTILLYASVDPLVTDEPIAEYRYSDDTGRYSRQR